MLRIVCLALALMIPLVARAELRGHGGPVRALAVSPDGRLLLNGRPTSFRGVGIHEDHPVRGNALTNADREQIVAWTRQLGGTAIRSHYPLHPHLYELGDRLGILMWSEVPVYQMPGEYLGRPEVRGAGVDMVRRNVLANGNHASVFTWSVANELADVPAQPETDYLAAAAAAAKELDRSRPVSYALAGHPLAGCPAAYAPFDLLGLNDYFGWGGGQVARREDIRPYLDQMRGCYPSKALVVTETGAEANRSGPAGEKGTYEFQREYARHHLREYAATPYLSGAMWWTLQDFRIRPNWTGGNPRPTPPMHQKALIHFDGTPKPAFEDVREGFGAVEQYP